MSFVDELNKLVEDQGTTLYVSLALGELGLTNINQVQHQQNFVARVVALFQEDA